MGRKKEKITEQDVAKYFITTKESAEVFIERWMERHKCPREHALEKLKTLGVELSHLPDKH